MEARPMELQSDPNGSLIPSHESSVLRWEYDFQDWAFGFGQGEKSGFGMCSLRGRRAEAVFVMMVRSEGVVKRRWIGGVGWGKGRAAWVEGERRKNKKKKRGGRGVGVGERENQKKNWGKSRGDRREKNEGKPEKMGAKKGSGVLLNKHFFFYNLATVGC